MVAPTTQRARRLRNNPTDTERLLWQQLRGRQLDGYKFRRQYPVGPYVADFICLEKKLIVEVDGGQHASQPTHDEHRTAYLQREGFRVVRYWNNQVISETEAVVEDILRHLLSPP